MPITSSTTSRPVVLTKKGLFRLDGYQKRSAEAFLSTRAKQFKPPALKAAPVMTPVPNTTDTVENNTRSPTMNTQRVIYANDLWKRQHQFRDLLQNAIDAMRTAVAASGHDPFEVASVRFDNKAGEFSRLFVFKVQVIGGITIRTLGDGVAVELWNCGHITKTAFTTGYSNKNGRSDSKDTVFCVGKHGEGLKTTLCSLVAEGGTAQINNYRISPDPLRATGEPEENAWWTWGYKLKKKRVKTMFESDVSALDGDDSDDDDGDDAGDGAGGGGNTRQNVDQSTLVITMPKGKTSETFKKIHSAKHFSSAFVVVSAFFEDSSIESFVRDAELNHFLREGSAEVGTRVEPIVINERPYATLYINSLDYKNRGNVCLGGIFLCSIRGLCFDVDFSPDCARAHQTISFTRNIGRDRTLDLEAIAPGIEGVFEHLVKKHTVLAKVLAMIMEGATEAAVRSQNSIFPLFKQMSTPVRSSISAHMLGKYVVLDASSTNVASDTRVAKDNSVAITTLVRSCAKLMHSYFPSLDPRCMKEYLLRKKVVRTGCEDIIDTLPKDFADVLKEAKITVQFTDIDAALIDSMCPHFVDVNTRSACIIDGKNLFCNRKGDDAVTAIVSVAWNMPKVQTLAQEMFVLGLKSAKDSKAPPLPPPNKRKECEPSGGGAGTGASNRKEDDGDQPNHGKTKRIHHGEMFTAAITDTGDVVFHKMRSVPK